MPLALLDAANLVPSLTPTPDMQHTFVEHEDLKVVLLAGQNPRASFPPMKDLQNAAMNFRLAAFAVLRLGRRN